MRTCRFICMNYSKDLVWKTVISLLCSWSGCCSFDAMSFLLEKYSAFYPRAQGNLHGCLLHFIPTIATLQGRLEEWPWLIQSHLVSYHIWRWAWIWVFLIQPKHLKQLETYFQFCYMVYWCSHFGVGSCLTIQIFVNYSHLTHDTNECVTSKCL